MFLKKVFGKDASFYRSKGEKFMESGRYADARCAFEDALERIGDNEPGNSMDYSAISQLYAECGNHLASANIQEADYQLNSGNIAKAHEHLNLALELADDVLIRQKAEITLLSISPGDDTSRPTPSSSSCGGCSSKNKITTEIQCDEQGELSPGDRFELLVRPLPGDLPERYLSLGEEFAHAYLLSSDGNISDSLHLFQSLSGHQESDIILYEIALLHSRSDNHAACETFLLHALEINDSNPLCNLALVHLLIDAGRLEEALSRLQWMISNKVLPDQAGLLLGDVYQVTDNETRAVEVYSQLLSTSLKREAAERIITLLEKDGRIQEATYLRKNYLSGCC